MGISATVIGQWFLHKGKTIERSSLEAIANYLDITLEQAIREAGGLTAEERASQNGRQVAFRYLPTKDSAAWREAYRKSVLARRGKKRSPEGIARGLAARKRNGGLARAIAAAAAKNRSTDGRINSSLTGRLRHNSHPTPVVIQTWVERTATKYGVSESHVRKVWHKRLTARHLIQRGGRKPLDHRYALLQRFEAEQGITGRSRRPEGFWKAFGQLAAVAEGAGEGYTHQAMKDWHAKYVKSR